MECDSDNELGHPCVTSTCKLLICGVLDSTVFGIATA